METRRKISKTGIKKKETEQKQDPSVSLIASERCIHESSFEGK